MTTTPPSPDAGDPREDQYEQAERHAAKVVERYAQLPGAVALTDPAQYPPTVDSWNHGHAQDLDAGRIKVCACEGTAQTWAQPLFTLASRPDRAHCARCFDTAKAEVAQQIASKRRTPVVSCDLCGGLGGGELHAAVWRVGAVVVVAQACRSCLSQPAIV